MEGAIAALRTPSGLLRVLGTAFGLSIALGNMVGSGIFRSPGPLVGHAGGLLLAAALVLVGGLQAMLSANVWAEVSTSVPVSGGAVVVARRAFGDAAGLIVGWTDGLSAVGGLAQAAAAAAGFLALLIPSLAAHLAATAAVLIALLVLINWRGVVVGEITQMFASAAQGLGVAVLIGLLFWMARLPVPASAPAASALPTAGGLLLGYQLVYATFVGWSNVGYFTEETTDPGRSVPRALGWSIATFTVLYLAMLLALGHALPLGVLSGAEFPAGVALSHALGSTGGHVLSAVAFLTLLGCTNAGIMPACRTLLALGRIGYGPRGLTRVNAAGTPDSALFVLMAFGLVLVLTGRYETIFLLMGTLMMALVTIMDLAFFQLRRREPALDRPFRALGYPVLPAIALLLDFGILMGVLISDVRSTLYALGAVAVGVGAARATAHLRGATGMTEPVPGSS